jgi:hypothetical protein
MNLEQTAELIPVSQWVYDLYKVTYWSDEPGKGGRAIKVIHLTAACENHLESDANRNAPGECWMTWEIVKHNVGQPRQVGSIYNQPLYEDSRAHARRVQM